MQKKTRKRKVILKKIILLTSILLIAYWLNYIDYYFNNNLINGLLLFLSSFVFTYIAENDQFYIDTGIKLHELGESDSLNRQRFNLFNKQHKFIALYNMLVSIMFFTLAIISILMIIVYFFYDS